MEYIIPMLEMQVFLPEDIIMRQGEEGKHMYFITRGDCLVQVKDTRRVEYSVRTLSRGSFFGVSIQNAKCLGNRTLQERTTHCISEEQELLSDCKAQQGIIH